MNSLLVIMGVSGAGKTTVSASLARQTGWPFIEGDDHHSEENRAMQARGEPLTNAHRAEWVDAMARAVRDLPNDVPLILACSALNPFVRDRLERAVERPCVWIYLEVPAAELKRRLDKRKDHFMPASLLASQLAAMEPPASALRIDGTHSPSEICDQISNALNI